MVHTRFVLAILVFAAGSCYAQTDPAPFKRWNVGLNTGAGLAFRTLSKTENLSVADVVIRQRNDREEPRIALGANAVVGYRLSRCFGLEAGLGYAQMGWLSRFDFSGRNFGDIIDPINGAILQPDPFLPSAFTRHDIFHYAELRLAATMSLGKGRWSSISTVGIAPAFLIEAKTRTISEFADGRMERSSGPAFDTYERFNLFPFLSTGVAFRSGDRWEWRLQPSVRFGALQIIDAPITANIYSGSLEFGVRFAL